MYLALSWHSGFLISKQQPQHFWFFKITTHCVVIPVQLSILSPKRTLMSHEQHAHVMDLLQRENFPLVLLPSEWITYSGLLCLLSLEAITIFPKPLHLIYGHMAILMSGSKQKPPVEGLMLKHDETEIWLLWDPFFSSDSKWTETRDSKDPFILLAVCRAEVYNNREVTNVRLIRWFYCPSWHFSVNRLQECLFLNRFIVV